MDVAYFETRSLSRKTARAERRKTPFVGDFRQRVRLVHELGKLRRTEELADCRNNRLRVDQVVRHRRDHFLVHRHLFLDRAFHAHQADAELVFEQFADGANAAISEVIDVVDLTDVLAQLQQVADDGIEVVPFENAALQRRRQIQLDVELEPADLREVVLPRIEEHAFEQAPSPFPASADRRAAACDKFR